MKMNNWIAVTESGTVYTYDGHTVRTKNGKQRSTLRPWIIAPIPRVMVDVASSMQDVWAYLRENSQPEYPRVGLHLYVGSREAYRLSTPVVSLEILEARP